MSDEPAAIADYFDEWADSVDPLWQGGFCSDNEALRERSENARTAARMLRQLDMLRTAIGDPDELRWHRWHCEETGQHDADELELPPSAELLYTTPAAASDAAELDRLRRLPGEMTLKSFTAYEYNEAVQALLYPGSDPITGGTRELLVPTVQRVADARNLDLEGRD